MSAETGAISEFDFIYGELLKRNLLLLNEISKQRCNHAKVITLHRRKKIKSNTIIQRLFLAPISITTNSFPWDDSQPKCLKIFETYLKWNKKRENVSEILATHVRYWLDFQHSPHNPKIYIPNSLTKLSPFIYRLVNMISFIIQSL